MATAQNVAHRDGVGYFSTEINTMFTNKRLRKRSLKWTGTQRPFSVTLQNDKGFVNFAWISLIV